MRQIKEGKTKDVFELADGNYLLRFKDDITTDENGVFDPGANSIGAKIDGVGKSDLLMTVHFFSLLKNAGIPTHYVSSDIDKAEMAVLPAKPFGHGLEVICRYRAVGSFLRRYGAYAAEGQALDVLVEFTLKDDGRQDPPITKDTLVMLGIMSEDEFENLKAMARRITGIIKDDLARKGLELYDIKFEFGRIGGKTALIDEISAGSMRVYKDGVAVPPLELSKLVLND